MSARLIQFGLLSLLSMALAAPIAPSGGHPHFRKHGKCSSRVQTMDAIATNEAQAANVLSTPTATAGWPSVYAEPSSSAAAASPAVASPAVASPAVLAEAKQPSADLNNNRPQPTTAAANTPAAAPALPAGTTTGTTPASTPAAGSSSSGAKGGVAYTSASAVTPFIGQANIGWCYNWNANPGSLSGGIEYIPLLWGTQSTFTNSWVSDANSAIGKGATAVIGFNEPDHPQQANLDYNTAASAYKQYITNNFSGKVKLVSPSVTNGAAPMGLTYLQNFMNACSDCGIQAINIHWYDTSSNIDYFKSYIQGAYDQFKLPIWLTEFGTTDGNDQAFLEQVLPWLDSQTYVEKYAYFMAEDGKLLSGTQLSAAGQTYASA